MENWYLIDLFCLLFLYSVFKVMREEWEKYLLSKVELQAFPKRNNKKPKETKGFGILDGVIPTISGKKAEVSSISKQEHEALLVAASEISKKQKVTEDVVEDTHQYCEETGGRKKGRGKGRKKNTLEIGKNENEAATSSKIDTHSPGIGEGKNGRNLIDAGGLVKYIEKGVLQKHNPDLDAELLQKTKRLPPLHFYSFDSDLHILDILQPSVVILYHPDVAFIREIEIYKAENPSKKVKVYFLFYEESTEVQKFEASIRRENGAFESLIRQKSLMMIPANQVSSNSCLSTSMMCSYFILLSQFETIHPCSLIDSLIMIFPT